MSRLATDCHRRWFFMQNDAEYPLPPFTGARPERSDHWWYGMCCTEQPALRHVMNVIEDLQW
jgi:hypothetical protein